ncbi:hypothetical protein KEM52_001013 [Ascosphaera acerosa]|nr:hypothetical protein KEM52_001013 [Ascosphaera acerosa]
MSYGPAVQAQAQAGDRLPSFTDVVNQIAAPDSRHRDAANGRPPFDPAAAEISPDTEHSRGYRSAEEAVRDMAGGQEELLPRIVHYSGPSNADRDPRAMQSHRRNVSIGNAQDGRLSPRNAAEARFMPTVRRRTRAEYERDNGSPPLGTGPESRHPPSQQGRLGPTANVPGMHRPPMHPSMASSAPSSHQHHYQQPQATAHSPRLGPAGHYNYADARKFPSPASRPMSSVQYPQHGPGPYPVESPTNHAMQERAQAEQRKKEEFLTLMSRAWDVFHSAT